MYQYPTAPAPNQMQAPMQAPPMQAPPPSSPSSSPYGPPPAPPASANQNPDGQGPPNGYSHGGQVSGRHKTGSMIDAHFNIHELDHLDHLQGKKMVDRRSGERIYPHLEELIKNPHVRDNIHHHFKQHLATGGHVEDQETGHQLHQLAMDGRHGDREIAKIGPHTHHLFNYMAGHATRNPHDGLPEYWSLSGMLGSAGNAIKGFGSKAIDYAKKAAPSIAGFAGSAAQHLMPMATEKLTQHLGGKYGDLGTMAGQFAGQAGQAGANKLAGYGGPAASRFGSIAGQSAAAGLQGREAGLSPSASMGHALATGASNFDNPVAHGVGAAGGAMAMGADPRAALRQGAQTGAMSAMDRLRQKMMPQQQMLPAPAGGPSQADYDML